MACSRQRLGAIKDIVNTKIKFREPFRPFACYVLEEKTESFFDLHGASRHYPARFTLYIVDVKKAKRSVIPAIIHVDGTGSIDDQ